MRQPGKKDKKTVTTKRVIARLDIKGPNLVKGIHLEGLRVLGKPWDFARYYYENGADELIFQDVVASLYGRNCLYDIIVKTAKEIFIPLTVGGGLRTLEDIGTALRSGADKVSLNTAVIKNPGLIADAVKMFGASSIVVAIEAIKQANGEYLAFIDNGREYTGIEVFEWARKVEELGAGEILVTSVDKDGTGSGFDLDLVKVIAANASVPVIAHGGAACIQHMLDVFEQTEADAVAVASMLHYGFIQNISGVDHFDFQEEGNIEFIKKARAFKNFGVESVRSIKEKLVDNEVGCRT